ncbi:MAG: c-type cytochrome biogenesis protein CcmI [Rhodospirillaceae bacterium]
MNLFWIIAALITVLAVLPMVSPLLRRRRPITGRVSYDLEVYRDQLAEIERDLARGLIEPGPAKISRAEIGRRLLAATAPSEITAVLEPTGPSWVDKIAALAVMTLIPVSTVVVYLALGRPDLPAQPLAERAAALSTMVPTPQILEAVARLAQRLKAKPDDLDGWVLLAQSLSKLGRQDEAVTSWRQAARLATAYPDITSPDITGPEILGNLAEALTIVNQGQVPEEAIKLFESILASIPGDPRSTYFLALARYQAGDFKGALDRWVKQMAASPANAPWLPYVRQRIEETAGKLELDAATAMPQTQPPLSK